MESTQSVYPAEPVPTGPRHKFAELYQINGMENITVSEPSPTSGTAPFLFALLMSGMIIYASIVFLGLPH